MMRKSDFHYDLPQHLIAQTPLQSRTASRLLTLDGRSGEIKDRLFVDLVNLLEPGDLLVFNDTRVIPARLFAHKSSGGKLEILVERVLDRTRFLAHTRSNKPLRQGSHVTLPGGAVCKVQERSGDLWVLAVESGETVDQLLDRIGHIPLPPYIRRMDQSEDRDRYQTVYAQKPGAVAAPTAGLHFDEDMIREIQSKGIKTVYLTLHVGAGTFQPVRVENLDEHRMHTEYCEVNDSAVDAINECKSRGCRVIAVGTTSIRALETAAIDGSIKPFRGETDLFIKPGFRFSCVDGLITNFHLPESTLLTLVCAFAGYSSVMNAYRHAVRMEYRFFSYGDAMFAIRSDG